MRAWLSQSGRRCCGRSRIGPASCIRAGWAITGQSHGVRRPARCRDASLWPPSPAASNSQAPGAHAQAVAAAPTHASCSMRQIIAVDPQEGWRCSVNLTPRDAFVVRVDQRDIDVVVSLQEASGRHAYRGGFADQTCQRRGAADRTAPEWQVRTGRSTQSRRCRSTARTDNPRSRRRTARAHGRTR